MTSRRSPDHSAIDDVPIIRQPMLASTPEPYFSVYLCSASIYNWAWILRSPLSQNWFHPPKEERLLKPCWKVCVRCMLNLDSNTYNNVNESKLTIDRQPSFVNLFSFHISFFDWFFNLVTFEVGCSSMFKNISCCYISSQINYGEVSVCRQNGRLVYWSELWRWVIC